MLYLACFWLFCCCRKKMKFEYCLTFFRICACSDPVLHASTGERSDVKTLLQKLILEEDQFAVQDILPNTVPDPASLLLTSEYACPVGQVVMVPDCGKYT